MPLGDLRALPAESPLWGENPEGVINPRQGMKREARNPCSHGVKRENPEGVTDHRQAVERSASGLCPPNPPCGVRTPAPHVVNGKTPTG